MSKRQRLPGQPAWLACEWRKEGEKKYHLSNYPAQRTLAALARAIRGRWLCEPPHRQMKQELGLDHYEGRSWLGLRHHCLLGMIAYAFLQHLRRRGKKGTRATARRPVRASRKRAGGS
jgi:SRSO17 transposase